MLYDSIPVFPVSSLVNSLANLNAQTAGRLGYLTVIYFLVTTLFAVIEGIVLVLAIRPGRFADQANAQHAGTTCKALPVDTILDLLRFVPCTHRCLTD